MILRHRVPVGRQLLLAEPRRAALTVLGVATALLLVLTLQGIFAGAIERVTAYVRTSPAAVIVSQSGVRTMHMSASVVPADTAARVRRLPGVAWAAPLGFASGSVAGPEGRQLSYLIGYDTATGRGGPAALVAGAAPGRGEVVLDEQAASQLGLRVGDPVTVLGSRLRIVGLSSGGTSIANTTAFVSRGQFELIRGDRTAYVLVGAEPGVDAQALAQRIGAAVAGVTAQTRDQFAASEARVVTDMSADLLALMSLVGLLIALAVIALGLMTATLSRLRDFAVLKALGAEPRHLVAAVTTQVLWTVALAALTATLAVELLARSVAELAPSVQITVTRGDWLTTVSEALVLGLVAGLWPLRRVVTIDAVTAFRETR